MKSDFSLSLCADILIIYLSSKKSSFASNSRKKEFEFRKWRLGGIIKEEPLSMGRWGWENVLCKINFRGKKREKETFLAFSSHNLWITDVEWFCWIVYEASTEATEADQAETKKANK